MRFLKRTGVTLMEVSVQFGSLNLNGYTYSYEIFTDHRRDNRLLNETKFNIIP